jgi:hypothetical protein
MYVLGATTILGRGSDADIQLIDPTASRHHAKIEVQRDGTMVLIDLSSHNGTYVDRQRLRQPFVLEPGHEIRIGDYGFVYEEEILAPPVSPASESPAPPADDTDAWDPSDWIAEALADEGTLLGPDSPPFLPVLDAHTPYNPATPVVTPEEPEPPTGEDFDLQLVVVENDDESGQVVSGVGLDLLQEVLEYRDLRARSLRGLKLSPGERERLEALAKKHQRELGRAELASLRRFARFSCALTGQFGKVGSGVLLADRARIEDLGAGGALVTVDGNGIRKGEQVYLALDLQRPGELPRSVVLATRVVWTKPDLGKIGVAFEGPARYGAGMAAVLGPTK